MAASGWQRFGSQWEERWIFVVNFWNDQFCRISKIVAAASIWPPLGSSLGGTNTIDIYHPNLSSMRLWGSRHIEIAVIQWGDWDRTLNILAGRTQYAHTRKMYYAARAKVKSGKVVRN